MDDIQTQPPIEKIQAYCRKWKIQEMWLFGSVLRDDFGPNSDVDVLVRFGKGCGITFHNYVEMCDDLEAIFGCRVDLVERESVESSPNYVRLRHILHSAKRVYVA